MARSEVKPRRDKGGTTRDKVVPGVVPGDSGGGLRYGPAREALQKVLRDRRSPASARVFAARTLAEMDGQIGKHQAAPSTVPEAPLSGLSRAELASELSRLRALIDLGLVA